MGSLRRPGKGSTGTIVESRMEHGLDDLYAPPRADAERAASLNKRAATLFGCAVLGLLGSIVIGGATTPKVAVLPLGATAFIAIAGAVHAGAAAAKGGKTLSILGALTLAMMNAGMAVIGLFGAWISTVTFTRGRQIRRLGKIVLPPVAKSDAWTKRDIAVTDIDDASRDALAAQWRENGRTEHASVAAFARLTLDLVALGAPPELVASANRDALDEIRHAEQCFALARAIDGRAESPAAFPEVLRGGRSRLETRTMMLSALAVDSLIDGALNEGISARVVARVARRCAEPEIRSVLRAIAADEGRHSAHGWDVVRFCLAEGGAPVAHALAAACRALPSELRSPLDALSRDGRWERWGIPGAALEAEELGKTRADVLRRVAKLVAPYGIAAAA
jgi:hypothetical protein